MPQPLLNHKAPASQRVCDFTQSNQAVVALARGPQEYTAVAPFSPDRLFPEYPFGHEGLSSKPNRVYETVRDSLILLGLDRPAVGQRQWNPFRAFVSPGHTVVIKPNLVRDFRETQAGDGDCLITHGSVIRAVVDYVYIALRGCGRIVIADAPHNDADFERILQITQLGSIQEFYRRQAGFNVEVYDLRPERATKIDGVIVGHKCLPGDPAGYVRVNLGPLSEFCEVGGFEHLLYGSEYQTEELRRHHRGGTHEYLISRTVLQADCVIGVPKLKTHKKVGLTVNLKNLVGINGNKNWLPHHREGCVSQGGDQFAEDTAKTRVERTLVAGFKKAFPLFGPLRPLVAGPIKRLGKRVFGDTNKDAVRSGNWYGNDTTWRMVLDLNRILLYADADGQLHEQPVRNFFSIVDGIIGGEGNGPLDPNPRPGGVLLAGANAAAVDACCARVMGFDALRIPMIARAFRPHELPITAFDHSSILVHATEPWPSGPINTIAPLHAFEPHFGWKSHIELSESWS